MAAKRFDVNDPIPTGANDLSQSLRVVLICLIDLHLKSGTRMPGVKTHNFEAEIAEFMHEPWRHRSSFNSYAGVVSCMPTHHSIDLFWNGRALATPQPPTGIVDHADGGHLLRNIQASKTGHRAESPGDTARIAALLADHAPTAIIGCPDLSMPLGPLTSKTDEQCLSRRSAYCGRVPS